MKRRKPPKSPPPGYTLDSGALIKMENGDRGVLQMIAQALVDDRPLRIPSAVVVECWHDGYIPKELRELVNETTVIPDTIGRAKRAGIALSKVPVQPKNRGPGPVDALVAALAAENRDIVVTGDPSDITLLRVHLPGIAGIIPV